VYRTAPDAEFIKGPLDKLKALNPSKGSINPEQTLGLMPGKVEGLI
jgi:hypothetical protein